MRRKRSRRKGLRKSTGRPGIRKQPCLRSAGCPLLKRLTKHRVLTLEEAKKRYARHVLYACKGNRSAAARALDIDRNTLRALTNNR